MAETASIVSPDKRVLIPDPEAGCSLSSSITAGELREWKGRHPGAAAVGYVNTTADVKAELDYCCTSSNAVDVVNAIPGDREILFLPDMFLGSYVARVTGRKNIRVWAGECHVHAGITPEDVTSKIRSMPGAQFLIHPECSCTTPMLDAAAAGAYGGAGTAAGGMRVLSTEGMMRHAASAAQGSRFVVATETGILYRMRRQNPGKTFAPASEEAECKYMKMITPEKVRDSLLHDRHEVRVPPATASKARLAIRRMLEIG